MIIFNIILTSGAIFKPQQIHLSLTQSPNTLRVNWITWVETPSIVKYQQQFSDQWTIREGSSKKFYPGRQARWLYWIHTATMTNIWQNKNYTYKVGSNSIFSQQFRIQGFTSKSFSIKKPQNLWIFGDIDARKHGILSINMLKEETEKGFVDLVVIAGDMAYGIQENQGIVGNDFFIQMEPIAAVAPMMAAIGNHQITYNNLTHFKNAFSHPINQANEGTNLFYAFDFGLTHFIVFNTAELFYGKQNGSNFETQMNWLKKHLKELEQRREEIPWLFFCTHTNMYCSADWRYEEPQGEFHQCLQDAAVLRGYLEELLNFYRFDIVFQGHVHNYERVAPTYQNLTVENPKDDRNHYYEPQAPIYVTGGIAGNEKGCDDPVSSTPSLWSRYTTCEFSIGKLTIFN